MIPGAISGAIVDEKWVNGDLDLSCRVTPIRVECVKATRPGRIHCRHPFPMRRNQLDPPFLPHHTRIKDNSPAVRFQLDGSRALPRTKQRSTLGVSLEMIGCRCQHNMHWATTVDELHCEVLVTGLVLAFCSVSARGRWVCPSSPLNPPLSIILHHSAV